MPEQFIGAAPMRLPCVPGCYKLEARVSQDPENEEGAAGTAPSSSAPAVAAAPATGGLGGQKQKQQKGSRVGAADSLGAAAAAAVEEAEAEEAGHAPAFTRPLSLAKPPRNLSQKAAVSGRAGVLSQGGPASQQAASEHMDTLPCEPVLGSWPGCMTINPRAVGTCNACVVGRSRACHACKDRQPMVRILCWTCAGHALPLW